MQDALNVHPPITIGDLARLPSASTLVLTVNNRLARRLTLELAQRLRAERQVSELPRILPLSAWLAEAGDELTFSALDSVPAYRLDSFATQMVWTDAIREEESDRVLLDAAQAAKLAQDADMLMDEWQLQIPGGADTDEYRGFARWRQRYRRRLAEIDAEDANQGYARVLEAIRDGRVPFPGELVLGGFTELSPRFTQLLHAFTEGGVSVWWLREEQGEPTVPRRYQASDHGAEWRAAAQWAAQHLASHPGGRYAIISSQLEDESPFARRVLGRALAGVDGQPGFPFNVAVGRPLTEWPAVRAALAWLAALAEYTPFRFVDTSVLGAALLAGHCAGDLQEAAGHAAADARWRRQARVRVGASGLDKDLAASPQLAQAWAQAVEIWSRVGRVAACDAWMPAMKTALLALGFPGEKALDSVGYQVMGALAELLGRYAALAPAGGPMDGRSAVRLLQRAAQASSFQPQRDPLARLDVLGLLEAEGGHWDGVWMLGLTDDILPASPKPNPLLPLIVLKQAGAPRATPERERLWAETIFAALCGCAPEIIVSHAHQDGERELRPSPLIAALPPAIWQPAVDAPAALLAMQSIEDEQGPPLAEGLGSSGGLDVLDTQARNPMWAFVRHRLGGRALADYADAATVNVRGQFLHRALELLWRMMPDQEHLHEVMSEGRLEPLLAQAVGQAAEDELLAYPEALRELECERARAVLAAWFDLEAQRTPFVVDQVEQEHAWRRGALSLKLRLDRMDTLPDGRSLIVDYKTGIAPANPESDWSRARPINLQLPFYASVLMADQPQAQVAGLMLAQIHARQVGTQGLADEDLGVEGVTAAAASRFFDGQAWPDILQRWRRAIEGLADEYASGYAANTAYRMDDLKYCDAMPFLRLHLEDEDE